MRGKSVRLWLMSTVLLGTVILFGWYIRSHPEHITQLRTLEPKWIIFILLANVGGIAALTGLYQVLVRLVDVRLQATENILLTVYSSVANFFGPLQSGPGVRAAYLKAKYDLPVKRYVLVTLIAYAAYAVLSAFCMLVGTRPWWQTLLAVAGAACLSVLVIRALTRRRAAGVSRLNLTAPLLIGVLLCTALQILFITIRYYLSLRASGTEVSLGQALSYTGAANFALFVSVTPDGIGIREAFLLFSQNIHGVSTPDIVAASVVDRATYVLFLGLLFIFALSLHAKERITHIGRGSSTKKALH
ncbi:flippase-like domain-containing protein [Candidatus Saccharibacteria bacterium]|nr:MAG: flippase-like domain-containing protein [Candidatus Saccharibacteria bacterium]